MMMMSSIPNDYAGYSNYYPRLADVNGQEVVDPSAPVAQAPVSMAPPQDTASFSTTAPAPAEAPVTAEATAPEKKNGWLPWALGATVAAVGVGAIWYALTHNKEPIKGAAENLAKETTQTVEKVVENTAKNTPEVAEKIVENTAKTGKGVVGGIDFAKDDAVIELAAKLKPTKLHNEQLTAQINAYYGRYPQALTPSPSGGYNAKDLIKALENEPLGNMNVENKILSGGGRPEPAIVRVPVKRDPSDPTKVTEWHEFENPQLAREVKELKEAGWDKTKELEQQVKRLRISSITDGVPIVEIAEKAKTPELHSIVAELMTNTGPNASRMKKAAKGVVAGLDGPKYEVIEAQAKATPTTTHNDAALRKSHHLLKTPVGTNGGTSEYISIPNFDPKDHHYFKAYDFVDESDNPLTSTQVHEMMRKNGDLTKGFKKDGDLPHFTIVGLGKIPGSGGHPNFGAAAANVVKPKIKVHGVANSSQNVSVGLI